MKKNRQSTSTETPHRAELSYATDEDNILKRFSIKALEFISGRKKINQVYQDIQDSDLDHSAIWTAAVEGFQIKTTYDPLRLTGLPADKPLVFISNHPFGIIDGLILSKLIATVRPEFSILVNHVLCGHDPRVEKHLLPIDFRENKAAMYTNIRTKQLALERLKNGESIGIFPSGGVATSPNGWAKAEDLTWKRFTAKIIQMSKATVIPIYFHGENSRLFQLVSQFSMTLRLGLLIHEANNKMGKDIRVEIGEAIPFETIQHIKDRQEMLDYLYTATFQLGDAFASPLN